MVMNDTQIQGTVDPKFESVREAFLQNFQENSEVGAAIGVTINGESVIYLWGGFSQKDSQKLWMEDTMVNVFSMTKGMVAICAHILADRGLLDYDAPVAQYWPEFAQNGKENIPVRWLLSHQAGLVAVDARLGPGDGLNWDRMIHALEETTPQWEPGTKNGYHMVTFGWLVGEVIRRISGSASVGTFFKNEVVDPLGVDFFIGTPESEDYRIADIIPPAPGSLVRTQVEPSKLTKRSLVPASEEVAGNPNSRGWRGAEIPGANGHATARAVAKIYGAVACGGALDDVYLFSPERVDIMREVQVQSMDEVLELETRRSLGFMHPIPGSGDALGSNAFGHNGAGGSMGFADPEYRIGFGYVMSQMWAGDLMDPDPRAQLLARTVYQCLS
ncbi:MAG: beta-lactamase family protein [Dehalococcoidia bacterium]|nr:beta-lactamase family protein [Dehalococcoidia bacterium]